MSMKSMNPKKVAEYVYQNLKVSVGKPKEVFQENNPFWRYHYVFPVKGTKESVTIILFIRNDYTPEDRQYLKKEGYPKYEMTLTMKSLNTDVAGGNTPQQLLKDFNKRCSQGHVFD